MREKDRDRQDGQQDYQQDIPGSFIQSEFFDEILGYFKNDPSTTHKNKKRLE